MTLSEYITRHLRVPFCWGVHDCVLFVAGWVEAATGIDQLAGLPKWKTEHGAHRVIRSLGGLEAAMDARFKRIHPHLAKDGDIGLYGKSLCIFTGANLVSAGVTGLAHVNRMEAQCAWSLS